MNQFEPQQPWNTSDEENDFFFRIQGQRFIIQLTPAEVTNGRFTFSEQNVSCHPAVLHWLEKVAEIATFLAENDHERAVPISRDVVPDFPRRMDPALPDVLIYDDGDPLAGDPLTTTHRSRHQNPRQLGKSQGVLCPECGLLNCILHSNDPSLDPLVGRLADTSLTDDASEAARYFADISLDNSLIRPLSSSTPQPNQSQELLVKDFYNNMPVDMSVPEHSFAKKTYPVQDVRLPPSDRNQARILDFNSQFRQRWDPVLATPLNEVGGRDRPRMNLAGSTVPSVKSPLEHEEDICQTSMAVLDRARRWREIQQEQLPHNTDKTILLPSHVTNPSTSVPQATQMASRPQYGRLQPSTVRRPLSELNRTDLTTLSSSMAGATASSSMIKGENDSMLVSSLRGQPAIPVGSWTSRSVENVLAVSGAGKTPYHRVAEDQGNAVRVSTGQSGSSAVGNNVGPGLARGHRSIDSNPTGATSSRAVATTYGISLGVQEPAVSSVSASSISVGRTQSHADGQPTQFPDSTLFSDFRQKSTASQSMISRAAAPGAFRGVGNAQAVSFALAARPQNPPFSMASRWIDHSYSLTSGPKASQGGGRHVIRPLRKVAETAANPRFSLEERQGRHQAGLYGNTTRYTGAMEGVSAMSMMRSTLESTERMQPPVPGAEPSAGPGVPAWRVPAMSLNDSGMNRAVNHSGMEYDFKATGNSSLVQDDNVFDDDAAISDVKMDFMVEQYQRAVKECRNYNKAEYTVEELVITTLIHLQKTDQLSTMADSAMRVTSRDVHYKSGAMALRNTYGKWIHRVCQEVLNEQNLVLLSDELEAFQRIACNLVAEKLPSHLIYIDDKKGEISKLNPSQEVLTQMDNIYRKTAMTNYKLKIEQEMKLSNKGIDTGAGGKAVGKKTGKKTNPARGKGNVSVAEDISDSGVLATVGNKRKYDYWTQEEIKAFLNVVQIFRSESRRLDGREWMEFSERLKKLHNIDRNNDACRHQMARLNKLVATLTASGSAGRSSDPNSLDNLLVNTLLVGNEHITGAITGSTEGGRIQENEMMLTANRKARKRSIDEIEIVEVDTPQPRKKQRKVSQDSDDEDMTTNNAKAKKKGKVDKQKPPTLQERMDRGFSVLERMEQRLAVTGNMLDEFMRRSTAPGENSNGADPTPSSTVVKSCSPVARTKP